MSLIETDFDATYNHIPNIRTGKIDLTSKTPQLLIDARGGSSKAIRTLQKRGLKHWEHEGKRII